MAPEVGFEPTIRRGGLTADAQSTNFERKMAPEVGFEPTTNRLTADRSTTELLRSVVDQRLILTSVDSREN